jgi:cytosine/adenosine deaminase-related metal-dependent hydrolase
LDALAVIDAAAGAGGAGVAASPGTLLLEVAERPGPEGWTLRTLAAGPTREVERHEAARAGVDRLMTVRRPTSVLIPGLVNAHTHLDLTHIGPRPHEPGDGFVAWVDMVRAERRHGEDEIQASVRRGAELSLGAGVVAVGDIAGAPAGRITLAPWRAMGASGLRGVSYLEFFGIGRGEARTLARLEALGAELEAAMGGPTGAARLGLQPHAPNTVSRRVYRAAVALSRRFTPTLPLTTHLAETPEEREFVGLARGAQRALLERLGVWDDSILEDVGRGYHPVAHLAEVLASAPFTVAHVNDADDGAIEVLAQTGTRVAYCPRASAYFGAPERLGPHRYRDMLAAGVRVALGTDSLINLPPDAAVTPGEGGRGMSVFDEMRLLHARDGADPVTLLRMATVHGAEALHLDPAAFMFRPGSALAGVAELDLGPGTSAGDAVGFLGMSLKSDRVRSRLLFGGNGSGETRIGEGPKAPPLVLD